MTSFDPKIDSIGVASHTEQSDPSGHTRNNHPADHTELAGMEEDETVKEKKLRRRIDLLIMPIIIWTYLMNYIDRNNYAAARLYGLEEDLKLSDSQYQVALSALFITYVLGQVPSNLLLNYFGRPSLYLGLFTVAWGVVSGLTALVKDYGGMLACRLFLGLVEAPFYPGVIFYLSKWYTKKELSLRIALLYNGSLVAGAFGSLIAAGILGGMGDARGIAAWRWLYIIEGAITVVTGIAIAMRLPDFPETWKALSPEMRRIAVQRLARDAAEADVDARGWKAQLRGLKMAVSDPKVWIITVAYHALTGAEGFQNFFPTLTRSLGFSNTISLLLVAPPYVFTVCYCIFHAALSDKLQKRFWFFIYPIPISIAGCAVFMSTQSFGPRYFSLFLLNFAFTMNGVLLAWLSACIPRPPAKRAAAVGLINSLALTGNIWTTFTYYPSQGQNYRVALGIVIGLFLVAAAAACVLRWILIRENNHLALLNDETVEPDEELMKRLKRNADLEGVDIPAIRRQWKGFRYLI